MLDATSQRDASTTTDRGITELRAEQCRRWRDGDPISAESLLADSSRLRNRTEDALVLIGGEMALRRERGDAPTIAEYRRRFPELADDLELLFAVQEALEDSSAAAVEPGADIGSAPAIAGYEVHGVLGRGGASVVYRATQIALDRVVALKVMRRGAWPGQEAVSRFRAEALAVARLQHPNIVQVFEVGEARMSDGAAIPWLALELVDGPTLGQLCAGQPQPLRQSARWVETLAAAMHAAHQAGIVHRDLKPANVLVSIDGALKIADFGLAKLIDQSVDGTASGTIVGTPAYMAPEQAEGRTSQVGPACDIWSLGAILYALVTGQPPFRGETMIEIVRRVSQDEPIPPSRLRRDLPRDLETICLKCLEKEPGRRYASAADLADDLRRFQADEPVSARPIGTIGRISRWSRRQPLLASLIAVLLIGLPAALAGMTGLYLNANRERARAEERERDGLLLRKQAAERMASIGRMLIDQSRCAEAADVLQTSADGFARLAEVGFDPPECRLCRAHALINLSVAMHRTDRFDDALRFAADALAAYADCNAESFHAIDIRLGIRDARHTQAASLRALGRCNEAILIFDQLIAEYGADDAASAAPGHPQRQSIANLYHDRGKVQYELGRYAQSVAEFDEALRRDNKWWSCLVTLRAKSLARCGRAAEAIRDVRGPLANPHIHPRDLYHAACALALGAAADLPADEREAAAAEAVQLLRRTIAANPAFRTSMKTNTELASLANRPDFQALLREP